MAEHKTTQQAVREQYKVAETMAEQMLGAWADLATTTTEYTFEGFENSALRPGDPPAGREADPRGADRLQADLRGWFEDLAELPAGRQRDHDPRDPELGPRWRMLLRRYAGHRVAPALAFGRSVFALSERKHRNPRRLHSPCWVGS